MTTKTLCNNYEAARLLGLKHTQVDKLVREMKIPHVALPCGAIRFNPDELWQWAAQYRQACGCPPNSSGPQLSCRNW